MGGGGAAVCQAALAAAVRDNGKQEGSVLESDYPHTCFLKRLGTQRHGRPTWNATQPSRGHGEKIIITIGKVCFRNLTTIHVSHCGRFWQLHLSGEKHQGRMKRLLHSCRLPLEDCCCYWIGIMLPCCCVAVVSQGYVRLSVRCLFSLQSLIFVTTMLRTFYPLTTHGRKVAVWRAIQPLFLKATGNLHNDDATVSQVTWLLSLQALLCSILSQSLSPRLSIEASTLANAITMPPSFTFSFNQISDSQFRKLHRETEQETWLTH